MPENTRKVFEQQAQSLKKHEEILSEWDMFVQKCSSRLERDPILSQMNRADSYRNRIETAINLDMMKSDFERYGPNIWYMTLRKMEDPVKTQTEFQMGKQSIVIGEDSRFPLIKVMKVNILVVAIGLALVVREPIDGRNKERNRVHQETSYCKVISTCINMS